MKHLNTLPIEDFLDKARIAIKSNQKSITLTLQEVINLQSSLAIVMTKLAGDLDQKASTPTPSMVQIKMDGGKF
jgi:hypothetical protein